MPQPMQLVSDDRSDTRFPRPPGRGARERTLEYATDLIEKLPDRMTVDEASETVQRLFRFSRLHEDIKWVYRFLMGEVARRVHANTSRGEKGDAVRALASEWGLNPKTLRYAMGAADALNGNVVLFSNWLEKGSPKRWKDIKELARTRVDVSQMDADDLHDEIVARIEGSARDLEAINEQIEAEGGDESARRSVQSAQTVMTEEAVSYQRKGFEILHSEPEDGEDPFEEAAEYFRAMVQSMPCMACGDPPRSNPSAVTNAFRVEPSVAGMKRSAWAFVPLCDDCEVLARTSERALHDERAVTFAGMLARTLHLWICGDDLRLSHTDTPIYHDAEE